MLYLLTCSFALATAFSAAAILYIGTLRGRSYFTTHNTLYVLLVGSMLTSLLYIERMTDWVFTSRVELESVSFNTGWVTYHLLSQACVFGLHRHIYRQVMTWRRENDFGQAAPAAR